MTGLDITATADGPLLVRGAFRLQRKDGSLIAEITGEARLCRCGHSDTKPLCDDAHLRAGFRSRPAGPWNGRPADPPGPAVVTVRRNGPYAVEGPAVVRDADGRVLAEGSRLVLCRCGRSGTAPFCDATHRSIGFEAD